MSWIYLFIFLIIAEILNDETNSKIEVEEQDQVQAESTELKKEEDEQAESKIVNEEEIAIVVEEEKQEEVFESLEEKTRKGLKESFTYLLFVMDKIQSKSKSISSIHKSKLDWKSFTKKEKLEKKFEQNRKSGYLDK